MGIALIFPGQGSQFIGMGKDLYENFKNAREVFNRVDNALSQDLSKLMFEGDGEELNMTQNTQPALMAVSMAVMAALEDGTNKGVGGICTYVAGHSLGEYSALTAAGAFDIEITARLLKLRGQAMQRAVPVGMGKMAAILGMEYPEVEKLAKDATAEANKDSDNNLVCQCANDNSTGQVVISGHTKAVDIAITLAGERGAKKAVELPVSAPFHCSLMEPAAQEMADALKDTEISPPCVPVIANVTARPTSDPQEIKKLLIEQVTGTVRWRESIMWMKENGIDEVIEIGAGKVLSGLIRRIDKTIKTSCVGTTEQVEELVKKLDNHT